MTTPNPNSKSAQRRRAIQRGGIYDPRAQNPLELGPAPPGITSAIASHRLVAHVSMLILRYIAEEVQRQGDAPIAVYWMARAWESAQQAKEMGLQVTPGLIERWGQLIQPELNPGFRTVNVQVGDYEAPHHIEVPVLIQALCDQIVGMPAEDAYRRFQEIHPFRDGNGRVGKVLFCYVKGALSVPQIPPNFWNVSNP